MTDGLLLIHAFPLDATMWQPQVEEFEGQIRVFAPNLPGFGGTEALGPVMGMEAAADTIAKRAREEAGFDTAVVCGLSMGGYVALALWRRHPELISGLVLANTKGTADDPAAKERRRQLAARLRAEGSRFLVENPPPILSEEAAGELIGLVKNMIASQPAESIAAASLGMAERPDSTRDLPGITVPTLVITADKDTLIPPAASKAMADEIPNARFEVIEHAGHLSNLQAPDKFNALLYEHLERVSIFEHEPGEAPHPPKSIRGVPLL